MANQTGPFCLLRIRYIVCSCSKVSCCNGNFFVVFSAAFPNAYMSLFQQQNQRTPQKEGRFNILNFYHIKKINLGTGGKKEDSLWGLRKIMGNID